MSHICNDILEAVGSTPIIRLNRVTAGIEADVLAKVESFNPGGSVKDRIAISMLEDAEEKGLIKPGYTLIEPTSGNTGTGLAIAAAVKGYKIILTMPDKMSQEKINMLKAYGAKVVVTPTAVAPDSPQSYYSVADKLLEKIPNSFMPSQYFNQKNPEAHYKTTGPEIWEQTGGKIDCFVAGMGTGGTISGVGKFLKEKKPDVKIIGADPVGSILKDYFYTKRIVEAHPYRVEGIGEDIIPATTHFEFIDEIITVTDKESFLACRRLVLEEGLLVGGSSGSALHAALEVAKKLDKDKTVVVLLPDTGTRYLTKCHSEEWLIENGYLEGEINPVESILAHKDKSIPPLVSIKSSAALNEAVELMAKHGISQMPVFSDGKVVGSLRDDLVVHKIQSGNDLSKVKVEEVMGESSPVINFETDLQTILQLLERGNPTVLVEKNDNIEGIISRIDIIEYLSRGGS